MRKTRLALAAALLAGSVGAATPAQAQDPFIAQLQLFGTPWCPKGWLPASGTLLSINQYQALYSLIGTTYGGDGRATFALPNLNGRTPIGFGQGNGLSNYAIGQSGGAQFTTLTVNQMPAHTHSGVMMGSTSSGTIDNPQGQVLASFPAGINAYSATTATVDMAQNTLMTTNTGGNQSFSNMQPYLVMTWCVATVGVFPSRG